MTNNQITPSENIAVPFGGTYNSGIALQMKRRGSYHLADSTLTVQRNYNIGGSTYRVNSVFDTTKKAAVDGVRHLIDADLARSDNIQLTFPKVSSMVAVAETQKPPQHTQSA